MNEYYIMRNSVIYTDLALLE